MLRVLMQSTIVLTSGRSMLSSIKTIYKLHSEFLKDLENEVQSLNPVKLGKLFIELVRVCAVVPLTSHQTYELADPLDQ